MNGIDRHDIEKLRRLGATEVLDNGSEGVRVTAQYRGAPMTRDRKVWQSTLRDWEHGVSEDIREFGARTVEGSLSITGQTVELVLPVKELDAAVQKLTQKKNVRLRLLQERKIDPEY